MGLVHLSLLGQDQIEGFKRKENGLKNPFGNEKSELTTGQVALKKIKPSSVFGSRLKLVFFEKNRVNGCIFWKSFPLI